MDPMSGEAVASSVLLVSRADQHAAPAQRAGAGVAAAVLGGVLVVAASLTPSPLGHSTHEQLGLPACAFLAATGRPCPTCGMTTAFANMAHGSPLTALMTQPMGAILALATAVGFWACLHVAGFGSRLGGIGGKLLRPRVMWLAGGMWAASWVYIMATWRGG